MTEQIKGSSRLIEGTEEEWTLKALKSSPNPHAV